MKSKVKFIIVCPVCGKENRGKPIVAGYVNGCRCGYIFSKEEKDKAIEEIKILRNKERQRE